MRNPVPVTLEKTTSGKKYLIKDILEAGPFRRVLDLGIVPGTIIEMIRTAPFGDPVQFKARGFHFFLRKEEARHILVEVAE
jgi:ferrous iron transport protein A